VPGDNLDNCKLLHVACAEMIDVKTAAWIEKFVRDGGKLIVEFPFACRDERTWVSPKRPAMGLDLLLGCTEGERIAASSSDSFSLDGVDAPLPAGIWRIALESLDASEIVGRWSDGKAAAILNPYGKGKALALGGSLSLGFDNSWNAVAFAAMKTLLARLEVKTPAWAASGLLVNKRQGNGCIYYFAFNCSETEHSIDMPFAKAATLDSELAVLVEAKLTLLPGGVWIGKSKE